MGRVKIVFPDKKPLFISTIQVRISDINYGNHVGNDSILSIIHEARMQLLASFGYTELDAGGNSLIMADVMIAYKAEAFYGDILEIAMFADEISTTGFSLLYLISTHRADKITDIAHAKTGMVCFDYEVRRVRPMTENLADKLTS